MPNYLITGPDGSKYRVTAPEGASQDEVMKYVQGQHQPKAAPAPEKAPDPTAGDTETYFDIPSLSFKQRPGNFAAALGGGAERFVRGAGNLAVKGLNKVLPSDPSLSDLITGDKRAVKGGWFSDEAVRAQDQLDKPLEAANPVGYGIGEALPTLPVGEAAGALSTASRAIPYVGKVLGSTLARYGLEGAVDSAAVADADKQGEAAGEGAGVNIALGGLTKALGRVGRGIVQKSQSAEDLQHLAGQQGRSIDIPVSQAGSKEGDLLSRGTQAIYREALPLIPGVEGQLNAQKEKALGTFREMAMSEADPTGTIIKAGSGTEGLQARRALKDAFDQQYTNTVNSYSFNVPKEADIRSEVESLVKTKMPKVDDTTLKKVQDIIVGNVDRFSSGQSVVDGENFLHAKDATNAMHSTLHGPEKDALAHASEFFDNHIENELQQGGVPQNLQDLDTYQHLSEPLSAFKQLNSAIEAAKPTRGQFSPAQLAKSATDPGTLLHLGTVANETIGQPVARPSTAGRVAAYSLGALGGYHNPLMLGGAVGGANLLATKTVQRAVMGDTAAQKALSKMIDQHPDMARIVNTFMRGAASTQAGASNGSP